MAFRYFLFLHHRLFTAASLTHPKAFLFLVSLLFDKILSEIWWKTLQGGRPCKSYYSITLQGRFSEALDFGPRDGERVKTCLFPLGNVSRSLHKALERIRTVAAGGGNWAGARLASPQLNFSPVVIDYSGSFIILSVTIWASVSSKSWLHLMRRALNLSA